MMSGKSNKLAWRAWLNPASSMDTGSVRVLGERDKHYFDITLEIRDCSRSVSLNFDIDVPADFDRRQKKIDKLREALDHIEEFLYNNREGWEKDYAELLKKRKKFKESVTTTEPE